MTQYEQIIEVLKKLGGKATFSEICGKMDFSSDDPKWNTKIPKNSVSRYLSCSSQIDRRKEMVTKIRQKFPAAGETDSF